MASIQIGPTQLFRVLMMLFGEQELNNHTTQGSPVHAVWLHGRSFGDEHACVQLAANLVLRGKASYILLNGSRGETWTPHGHGTTPGEAWAGFDDWRRKLLELGVPNDRIVKCAPAYHSRQEGAVFTMICAERGWSTGVVIAQVHQLLRAWLGDIKAIALRELDFALDVSFPCSTSWSSPLQASQGRRLEKRCDDIGEEFRRLTPYMERGDIATLDEAETYLKALHKVL